MDEDSVSQGTPLRTHLDWRDLKEAKGKFLAKDGMASIYGAEGAFPRGAGQWALGGCTTRGSSWGLSHCHPAENLVKCWPFAPDAMKS